MEAPSFYRVLPVVREVMLVRQKLRLGLSWEDRLQVDIQNYRVISIIVSNFKVKNYMILEAVFKNCAQLQKFSTIHGAGGFK